jgi:DNA recombination protein RmuC
VLLLVAVVLLVVLVARRPGAAALDTSALDPKLDALAKANERTDRAVRDEIAKSRDEAAAAASRTRDELAAAIAELTRTNEQRFEAVRAGLEQRLTEAHGTMLNGMRHVFDAQGKQLEAFATQLGQLTTMVDQRLEAVRGGVQQQLQSIQDDNTKKLEQMRSTVEEKLQGTLDKRLGESFKAVSERLEQVHRGLGEMQQLATGVGDLKRVLTNVKTRGLFGEVQLKTLLEDFMLPSQYAENVDTAGNGSRVEFAVKLPGKGGAAEDAVWLPIDAKFPTEDWQRLVDAQERADGAAAEIAGKQLEVRIRGCAAEISAKYIGPPRTTEFAILFLPTEGLFAEVVRRPGLSELLQREYRVLVAGPTTLCAVLNSLRMGFRTLAIEQRTSEVWQTLGDVKAEFDKFGAALAHVKRKLNQASNTIEHAERRTRVLKRKLRDVEQLPSAEVQPLSLFDVPVEVGKE